MIMIHNFGIELKEYENRGKKNAFPVFDRCPNCHCFSQGNLHRNGFYWRYGIGEDDQALYIPICRFRCHNCKVNISILPDFLIPYYQHTLSMMVNRIDGFLNGKKVKGSRQQLAQHITRFIGNLSWIHSFFVGLGQRIGLSQDQKKEAQKYVKMIRDIGVSSFFRKSWSHLSSYFMGKFILPYLARKKNISCPT